MEEEDQIMVETGLMRSVSLMWKKGFAIRSELQKGAQW
jgi:hypothetical protein